VEIVDDVYVGELADAVTGSLGGKVGVAPRVFLKKLGRPAAVSVPGSCSTPASSSSPSATG
jgi:hypothetical protein